MGRIKIGIGFSDKAGTWKISLPKIFRLPVPNICLKKDMIVIAIPKPIPIPTASKIAFGTLFFEAKASALPSIIQLTTINGIKIPRDSLRLGRNACIVKSTIVTRVAMITIKTGILTRLGVYLRISETIMFELINTKRTAAVIPKALSMEVLTAKVGHKPNSNISTGLDLIIPFFKISIISLIFRIPPHYLDQYFHE